MAIYGEEPDYGTPVASTDGGTLLVTPSSLWSGAFVEVDMHTHVTGLATVTVTRTASGVTETVRGLDAVLTPAGMLAGCDPDAPRGVTCTYVATCTAYTTGAVDVTVPDGPALLKSLSDPRMNVQLGVDAYPDWTDGINDNVIRIIGRPDPIVTDDGVRWTGEGTVQGVTRDPATRDKLRGLLATGGGPFLLQPSAASDEPDVFVHIRATKRSRWSQQSQQPRRNHELPIVEVVRPDTAGAQVVTPGHTFADLTGTFATQTATRWFDL
jgi:hypothetical protein